MLPPFWRFMVYNDTGEALANLVITYRRWYFNSSGELTFEGSEQSEGGISTTLADATYDASASLNDNTVDKYLGLHGRFFVQSSASGTPSGDVTLWLQHNSADDDTELDDEMDGNGVVLAVLNFTTTSEDFATNFEV